MRWTRWRGLAWSLLACATTVLAVQAHIRLIHSGNGRVLFWQTPEAIEVTIHGGGSDDLSDRSHIAAIQHSIASWNAAQGTSARLIEDTSPQARARADWASDDLHAIFFDETGASGYFPAGSGTVAVTPVWFTSNGRIVDADVLFNGRGFRFTTSGESGALDIEDVATHELGHLLGLDHSGSVGASLYPYVTPGLILHRSISSDDEHGLREAYPAGGGASIKGRVRRAADQSPVGGAFVVARTLQGRSVASALATKSGNFALRGLDGGDYVLYATPLDHPVSSSNLTQGRVIQIDFQSTLHGAVHVDAGDLLDIGDLTVAADSPFSLGRNFDPLPLAAERGRSSIHSLHGAGLQAGSSLAASDASVQVAPLAWLGNQVIFSITVPAGSEPGHVDLTAVSPSGARSILPGALEITPRSPDVLQVVPPIGVDGGGNALTIQGRNFRAGAWVVIGEQVYADGAPGGCKVVDANTIQLTTRASPAGACDVVVIDPSGVEGRAVGGFQFQTVPRIDALFPPAGATLGGTRVTLSGAGFSAGCRVTIDGVEQTEIEVADPSRLVVTTLPGAPGAPALVEVLHPSGGTASAVFQFVAQPDPRPTAVSPAIAKSSGEGRAFIYGDDFPADVRVVFGADPLTGQGGVEAEAVLRHDGSTLEVEVPAHSPGRVSLMVADPATGQAALLEGAFVYESEGSPGACAASMGARTWSWRRALEGLAPWLAILAALIAARMLRRSRASAERSPAFASIAQRF